MGYVTIFRNLFRCALSSSSVAVSKKSIISSSRCGVDIYELSFRNCWCLRRLQSFDGDDRVDCRDWVVVGAGVVSVGLSLSLSVGLSRCRCWCFQCWSLSVGVCRSLSLGAGAGVFSAGLSLLVPNDIVARVSVRVGVAGCVVVKRNCSSSVGVFLSVGIKVGFLTRVVGYLLVGDRWVCVVVGIGVS